MKHFFFVSVALGIFSGTIIPASAQISVNVSRLSDALYVKKSEKFIEGIEMNAGTPVNEQGTVKRTDEITTLSTRPLVNHSGSGIENCSALQFKYAQLLDMDVESITNQVLYEFIEKWWATPYRYGGATQKGVDCSAYSGTLLHDVYGLVTVRTARDQYEACEKIDKQDLQEGDLVFFKTRRGVNHVGVYLRNGYFTHASVGNGVTISNLDEPYYKKKYTGGGKIAVRNTIE